MRLVISFILLTRLHAFSPPFNSSTRSSVPRLLFYQDEQDFYDGYDEFIKSMETDLQNDSFDIYNDEPIKSQEVDIGSASSSDSLKKSRSFNYNKNKRNNKARRPRQKRFYKRDPNDDMSKQVNEELVMKLIVQRSKAQKEKNYIRADDILHELNTVHGVYVWDKDSLWSCSSIAPSRRYGSKIQSSRTLNRYGHDYTQIGDEIDTHVCQLSLQEIHSLIAQRLECKLTKRFREADEIQQTLYENGVKVHDKLRQWRADSGVFEDMDQFVASRGNPFTKNEFSQEISQDVLGENENWEQDMMNLIESRDEARSTKDYHEADRIRDFLWKEYECAVDDKTRTYSIGGNFGPNGSFLWTDNGPVNPRRLQNVDSTRDWRLVGGMYTLSPRSKELQQQDQEEVFNLIHDRLEAKRVGDYDVADLIRDHLYKTYDISVDDQLRQFSAGGLFDENDIKSIRKQSPTTASGRLTSGYVRRYNLRGGVGHLSPKEVELVEALVQRRSEEMSRFNKQAAQSIRDGLKKKYYIIIDDVNCEYHVRGNDYILSPRCKEEDMPQEIRDGRTEIEMLIRERAQAKVEKDYARADEIRTDLKESYGIKVDDRLKEWSFQYCIDNDQECQMDQTAVVSSNEKLSRMTVVELKDQLRTLGLPVSGKKADLVTRLIEYNDE